MDNFFSRGYRAFDDAVMSGFNGIVKGWNYLTGDTKAGLANKLLTVSAVCFGASGFAESYWRGIRDTAIFSLLNHGIARVNLKTEELEANSSLQGLRHPYVEETKYLLSIVAPIASLAGMFLLGIPAAREAGYMEKRKNVSETPVFLVGAGLTLLGAAHYVMRADYMPPSKNILERGKEGLANLVRKPSRQTATERVAV